MSRRLRRILWAALILALLAPGTGAAEESVQALTRFFQSKGRELPSPPIDFQITAGYATVRTGSPESSGRYAMTAINVAKVGPDIHRLDMSLERQLPREGYSEEPPAFFTEQRTYYFWYSNGKQMVFKVGGKKVAISLGRKDVLRVDIHSPDTYTIDRETMLQNISFDDGPVTIHLQLKFK